MTQAEILLVPNGELAGHREQLAPRITLIEAGNQAATAQEAQADTARNAAYVLAASMAEALKLSADGRVGFGLVGGEAAEALEYLGEALDAADVPRDAVVAFELDERRNKNAQNWLDQGEKPGLRTKLNNEGIVHYIEVPEESKPDSTLQSFAEEYDRRLVKDIPRDQDGKPLYVALLGSGSQDKNPHIPMHVASKFPRRSVDESGEPTTYASAGTFIEAVDHAPKDPPERVTFKFSALADAHSVVVPYASSKKEEPLGENKHEVEVLRGLIGQKGLTEDKLLALDFSPAATTMVLAAHRGHEVTIIAGPAARGVQSSGAAAHADHDPVQPGTDTTSGSIVRGRPFSALFAGRHEVPKRFRLAVAAGYLAIGITGIAALPFLPWRATRRLIREFSGQATTDILSIALFRRDVTSWSDATKYIPPVFYNEKK